MSLLLYSLMSPTCDAASVSLEVGARDLIVGETARVELQLVDAVVRGVPEVPVGDGLSIAFQGQSQSRMVVNFKATRIVRYDFALTARTEGDWTVGPVSLAAEGGALESETVTVHVGPRATAGPRETGADAAISDAEPTLGEVVVYRFEFRHSGKVLDLRWTPPTFDGFVPEPVAKSAQREVPTALDGKEWTVHEILVPLVAAGEGARTVPPAIVTAQVPDDRKGARGRRSPFPADPFGNDPFGGSPFSPFVDTRSETYSTAPIPVTIRPLPSDGRPVGFSGLVGRFSLTATPSASEVRLGESVTVEYAIEGDGTLSAFRLPPAPRDAGWRAYDDAPTVEASVESGAFQARAVVRRAVVPEAEGDLEIAPISLTAFDPAAGSYATVSSEPVRLHVLPGEPGAGEVTSFGEGGADRRRPIEALGEDILPPHGSAKVADRTLRATLPPAMALPAIPAAGLCGLWAIARVRARQRDPWSVVRDRLDRLPDDPTARLAALEEAFRDAAGLRLGLPGPAVDRAGALRLGPEAAALYADLDAARYGGGALADLADRVRAFVWSRP